MHLKHLIQRGKVVQYSTAIIVNILSLAAGASMTWTSPVLPKLEDHEYSPFSRNLSSIEAMWMGALVSLGTAIGPFPCAYFSNRFGRKWTLLCSAIPCFLGWVLVASATTIAQLLVARLILGLSCSFVFCVLPTYVSEIAEDNIRGALGAFLQVFLTTGMLFSYCIGPYVSYVAFSSACGAIPILFSIMFFQMPESPYYLISKGKIEEAKTSLCLLRGKSQTDIEDESKRIQAAVEEEQSNRGTYRELCTSPAHRWPLFIGLGLAAFFQLSGVTAVVIYAETLFMKTSSNLSSDVMAIIMGIMQVASCLVTPFIFDRIGRKILLVFSSIGMTIAMATFGAYFYVIENALVNEQSLNWLPILCIITFIITNSMGFGGAIWVVMSEIFAVNVSSHAMAVCTSACFVFAFVIALTFDDLNILMKSSGTFWLYGAFCALSGIFVAIVVPETKGLSLQEIQQKLRKDTPSISAHNDEGRINNVYDSINE